MSETSVLPQAERPPETAPRRRGRPPSVTPGATKPRPALTAARAAGRASERARLVAAMVLEVLSGVRSPADAAQALEVAPVRYYQLEARAMAGLIQGCEPVARGRPGEGARTKSPDADQEKMRQEQRRLTSEIARLQALLRSAHGALGLKSPAPSPAPTPGKTGKRHRSHRPRIRALRLAQQVRSPVSPLSTSGDSPVMPNPGPIGG